MKITQGPTFATTLSLTEASDIHLLFMVALVAFAGIAGMSTIGLLLLLTPLAAIFMGRTKPRRVAGASTHPAAEPDDGSRPPSSFSGGDQTA